MCIVETFVAISGLTGQPSESRVHRALSSCLSRFRMMRVFLAKYIDDYQLSHACAVKAISLRCLLHSVHRKAISDTGRLI